MGVCTWIGHHNESAVGAVFDDLRDDRFEHVDVPLNQVEATLALLLTHTSRHHNQTGVGRHCIVWRRKREDKAALTYG